MKIAGAPISWGVCEVPGWGPMLPAERVLRELCSLGLNAIELGAPGFLPEAGVDVRAKLDEFGVTLVGGFVPVVVHDESQRSATLKSARRWAQLLSSGGGKVFNSAIVVDTKWSPRRQLSSTEWTHMLTMFDDIDRICEEFNL